MEFKVNIRAIEGMFSVPWTSLETEIDTGTATTSANLRFKSNKGNLPHTFSIKLLSEFKY
jgi:hypothetical protein